MYAGVSLYALTMSYDFLVRRCYWLRESMAQQLTLSHIASARSDNVTPLIVACAMVNYISVRPWVKVSVSVKPRS